MSAIADGPKPGNQVHEALFGLRAAGQLDAFQDNRYHYRYRYRYRCPDHEILSPAFGRGAAGSMQQAATALARALKVAHLELEVGPVFVLAAEIDASASRTASRKLLAASQAEAELDMYDRQEMMTRLAIAENGNFSHDWCRVVRSSDIQGRVSN
ncbi:hypothetical protein AK812_SmicGene27731 [Symbiodinium microadriaticum]|uniref:Uncharacterized protein n=1 Tax=Symbiodinium microadriaticum TaxID=2951 RepID=A0A1Q9D6E6_SYMMI|nr:hypothetical protein AK812_SmicGene27731 [Symbiodinium microadriaticum]